MTSDLQTFGTDPDNEGGSPTDAAAYIERLTGELKIIAARNNLDFLAYVLDMAREEAISQANRIHRDTPAQPKKRGS